MSLHIKGCIVSTCHPGDGVQDYIMRYTIQDGFPEPEFAANPPCVQVDCQPDDSIQAYNGAYSVQNTTPIKNSAIYVPVGGGFYVAVPPGQFQVVVPNPNNPTSFSIDTGQIPCPGTPVNPGCTSLISYVIPAGTSAGAAQAIVDAATAEAATIKAQCCLGLPDTTNITPPSTFLNTVQSTNCGGSFGGLKVTGSLPSGFTATLTTITCAAGVFTSNISQADADFQAEVALTQVLDSAAVQCGWWNQQEIFTCKDGSTQTTNANTFFSTVSQLDANNQALAAAALLCGGFASQMVWTVIANNGPTAVTITTAGYTATLVFHIQNSTPDHSGDVILQGRFFNNCGHNVFPRYIITGTTSGNNADGAIALSCVYGQAGAGTTINNVFAMNIDDSTQAVANTFQSNTTIEISGRIFTAAGVIDATLTCWTILNSC